MSRIRWSRRIGLALAVGVVGRASAQTGIDSGTIRIHLLGHAIGSERYTLRPDGDGRALTDTFEFTDRGGRVQLALSPSFNNRIEPLHFKSTGRTYRFVNIEADVDVKNGRAVIKSLGDVSERPTPRTYFAVAGYAPLEGQALLVRYWETHARPPRIALLPGDSSANATVEDLGAVRLTFADGGTIAAHRYAIDGVAWGREVLYTDDSWRFVAIVTRANLLPLEGLREDLAAGHPAMLDSIEADATRAELLLAERTRLARKPVAEGDFAVVGARIIDGTTGAPIDDGARRVRGGRIAAVGPRRSVAIPTGVRVIDARGKTIIPGMWDMHAHVALPEWGPAYLGVGVTTARDMGGERRFLVAFRDALGGGRGL